MSFRTAYKDPTKITVTLPKTLLVRLDEYVPSRKRSRFIAEAIESRLALEEQLTALDETAGAWSDGNHPEMETEEDIDRWIDDIRASWSASDGEHHG